MEVRATSLICGSFLAILPLVASISDNSLMHGTSGPSFSYKSTNQWLWDFPTCGGRWQSPINIQTQNVRMSTFPPLRLIGYDWTPSSMNVTNNGHTVEVTATWPNGYIPVIVGGPLNGPYEFAQMHFHWGNRNDVGSEHTINGQRLSLEMHVVHFRRAYGDLTEALKYDDGVAVLGYLFTVNRNSYGNEGIERLLESVAPANTFGPENNELIRPFPLTLFDLDSSRAGFYTYLGSLTTPPCSESVIWMVARTIKSVSLRELSTFREFPLEFGDDQNYRPTQPLNDRSVFRFRNEMKRISR